MITRTQAGRAKRIPSGIKGLDTVLNGGFLQSGVYIFIGPPGAGKTILANQIAFRHAADGGRVVYVSLLAESHARLFMHMEGLEFFDQQRISDSMTYVSGYNALEKDGLPGLLTLLRREMQTRRATMLVLDGLVSAEAFAASALELKKFVHELQTIVSLVECTAFLLTSGSHAHDIGAPEHTMVDGLIELANDTLGVRQIRTLQVKKFRGSAHLGGTHSFTISSRGITIYPRLEAVVTARQRAASESNDAVSTGIAELDAMFSGGLSRGCPTLVLGPPGSGKTIVALHFLEAGLRAGERCLYLGFQEPPERLLAKAARVGLHLQKYVDEGLLEIKWHPSVDLLADALAHEILDDVRGHATKRVVIDSLDGIRDCIMISERTTRFMAALANELCVAGATTYLCDESRALFSPGVEVPQTNISAYVDNILFVRQVELDGRLLRLAAVLKTRDSARDPALRMFSISQRGLRIEGALHDAEAALTGTARKATTSSSPRKAPKPRAGKSKGKSNRRRR